MEKLTFGIWPDGSYVTFYESAKNEYGTIDWGDVIGVYGSAEEARAAVEGATESSQR
jgi:hypothetical protein